MHAGVKTHKPLFRRFYCGGPTINQRTVSGFCLQESLTIPVATVAVLVLVPEHGLDGEDEEAKVGEDDQGGRQDETEQAFNKLIGQLIFFFLKVSVDILNDLCES